MALQCIDPAMSCLVMHRAGETSVSPPLHVRLVVGWNPVSSSDLFRLRLTAATTPTWNSNSSPNPVLTVALILPQTRANPRPAWLVWRGVIVLGKALLIGAVRAHLRDFACTGRHARAFEWMVHAKGEVLVALVYYSSQIIGNTWSTYYLVVRVWTWYFFHVLLVLVCSIRAGSYCCVHCLPLWYVVWAWVHFVVYTFIQTQQYQHYIQTDMMQQYVGDVSVSRDTAVQISCLSAAYRRWWIDSNNPPTGLLASSPWPRKGVLHCHPRPLCASRLPHLHTGRVCVAEHVLVEVKPIIR